MFEQLGRVEINTERADGYQIGRGIKLGLVLSRYCRGRKANEVTNRAALMEYILNPPSDSKSYTRLLRCFSNDAWIYNMFPSELVSRSLVSLFTLENQL